MATIAPPTRVSNIPIMTGFPLGSRRMSGESRATHNGVVVTSTTELATLVYFSEDIQVAKCNARKKPDKSARRISFRVRILSSCQCLVSAIGARMTIASVNL